MGLRVGVGGVRGFFTGRGLVTCLHDCLAGGTVLRTVNARPPRVVFVLGLVSLINLSLLAKNAFVESIAGIKC